MADSITFLIPPRPPMENEIPEDSLFTIASEAEYSAACSMLPLGSIPMAFSEPCLFISNYYHRESTDNAELDYAYVYVFSDAVTVSHDEKLIMTLYPGWYKLSLKSFDQNFAMPIEDMISFPSEWMGPTMIPGVRQYLELFVLDSDTIASKIGSLACTKQQIQSALKAQKINNPGDNFKGYANLVASIPSKAFYMYEETFSSISIYDCFWVTDSGNIQITEDDTSEENMYLDPKGDQIETPELDFSWPISLFGRTFNSFAELQEVADVFITTGGLTYANSADNAFAGGLNVYLDSLENNKFKFLCKVNSSAMVGCVTMVSVFPETTVRLLAKPKI